jgi:hypothetical protein
MGDCVFTPPIIQGPCEGNAPLLDIICPIPTSIKSPFISMFNGHNGFSGCDGKPGTNGSPGANGTNIPGSPGSNGPDGAPGKKGSKGCGAGNGVCSQAIFS